jgi:L-xylulokinase
MSPLILGLDVGSTLVKAAVFDRRGRELASASRRVGIQCPHPGWMERDAGKMWQAASEVLRTVAAGHASRIAGVGLTGCGNGAVFVDRDGRAVRAGILSGDLRARNELPPELSDLPQKCYPGQTAVLLGWLRRQEPRIAARTAHVLFWKDYVRWQLTGVAVTDFTDAGASGLLDRRAGRWWQEDRLLPPLQSSLAQAGAVTRPAARRTELREGTPVFTGCIDCEAAAIGSGAMPDGRVSVIAGTWSINQAIVRRLPRCRDLFLVNPSVLPGHWLLLEGSPTSALNFDWAARVLEARGGFLRAEARAARVPHSGLLFMPRVPAGEGAFIGLGLHHSRADLLRAVMEGVVFSHRAHIEKLERVTGKQTNLRLAGGATRSRFWCQLFADGLGKTIEVPVSGEVGALGAALCAAVGAGLYPTLAAAQRSAVRVAARYHPRRRQAAQLDATYRDYLYQCRPSPK